MPPHVKINATRPRVQYVADGSRVTFVFPFVIFAASDLDVFVGDTGVQHGYRVAGVGETRGGSVTFTAPPTSGSLVTLRRQLVLQRMSDFQESGSFRARVLNDELDYLIAALQQLEAELTRCIRLKPTGPDAALVLPDADVRAGAALAFDEQGNVILRAHGAGDTGRAWQSLDDIPEGQKVKRLTAGEKKLIEGLLLADPFPLPAVTDEEKSAGQLTDLRSFSPKDIIEMIGSWRSTIIDGGGADSF